MPSSTIRATALACALLAVACGKSSNGGPAGKSATTTTLAKSDTVFGQQATLTATVASTTGAGTPAGSVDFKDGASVIPGCSARPLTSGQAVCTASALGVGSHTVSASYLGDAAFEASNSATTSLDVAKAATAVALQASTSSVVLGRNVVLTATVTVTAPGAGTPSGSVSFRDGGVALGPCTAVAVSAGKAACTLSTLAVGLHSLTAVYVGDANLAASAPSNIVGLAVVKDTPDVAITVELAQQAAGGPVQFKATLVGGGSISPTGTVSFQVDGTDIAKTIAACNPIAAQCSTNPVALVAGTPGVATALFTSSATDLQATGSPHAYRVVYPGDGAFNGGTSSALNLTLGFRAPSEPPVSTLVAGGAADGLVLVSGGSDAPRETRLLDRATGATTPGPALAAPRAGHAAVALGGGRVLLAGGTAGAGPLLEVCALDGAAARCAPAGGEGARCHPAASIVTASPLRVLVAGGDGCGEGAAALDTWVLWEPDAAAATPRTGGLLEARTRLAAVQIAEGEVLLLGGGDATTEVFSLVEGPRAGGALLAARSGPTATVLPPGSGACASDRCALVAGGARPGQTEWEIVDLATLRSARPEGFDPARQRSREEPDAGGR